MEKIKKSLLNSERLKEIYGDKLAEKVDNFIKTLNDENTEDIDFEPLYHIILERNRNAIENELTPHFKGRFTNEIGRKIAKALGLSQEEISDGKNIDIDLLAKALESQITKAKEDNKGGGNENERIKALEKTLAEVQEAAKAEKEDYESKLTSAVNEKNTFIESTNIRKQLYEQVKKAYEGAKLREGLTIDEMVEDYLLYAERNGITFKINNNKLEARKKDNPEEIYLDGVNNLDIQKHSRKLLDTKLNPVVIAGQSFGRGQFQEPTGGGKGEKGTGDEYLDGMAELSADLFKSE